MLLCSVATVALGIVAGLVTAVCDAVPIGPAELSDRA
jgi:hypothetical protein